MSRAVLSIGSNRGDRLAHLAAVVAALRDDLVGVSPVYQTAPWGPVIQDDFFNAVVVASRAGRTPGGWLDFGQVAERAAERVRDQRWGPRTLDVDVVQVVADSGEVVVCDHPDLILPHPRAVARGFVLVPWSVVEPGAVLCGHGPVRELVAALSDDERAGVRRRDDLSLER